MLARIYVLGCALALLAGVTRAQDQNAAQPPADLRAQIASKIPGTRAEDLHPTPVAGIYELTRGTDIAYVTVDGKYAISGNQLTLTEAWLGTRQAKQKPDICELTFTKK